MMICVNNSNTCCFFGHRTIKETEELREKIIQAVEKLITEENVDVFLFGSKSRFDSLCLELVTEIKEKYPHIKRIYVRAEFPVIDLFAEVVRGHLLSGAACRRRPGNICRAQPRNDRR